MQPENPYAAPEAEPCGDHLESFLPLTPCMKAVLASVLVPVNALVMGITCCAVEHGKLPMIAGIIPGLTFLASICLAFDSFFDNPIDE